MITSSSKQGAKNKPYCQIPSLAKTSKPTPRRNQRLAPHFPQRILELKTKGCKNLSGMPSATPNHNQQMVATTSWHMFEGFLVPILFACRIGTPGMVLWGSDAVPRHRLHGFRCGLARESHVPMPPTKMDQIQEKWTTPQGSWTPMVDLLGPLHKNGDPHQGNDPLWASKLHPGGENRKKDSCIVFLVGKEV